MAAHSSTVSLREYLKRYQSCTDEPKRAKKKKKKKENPKPHSTGGGVRVVDEDPVWQKPVQYEDEEEDNSIDDETPQIEEDIEVKRMKRLEAIRSLKPYHSIGEDGSGWVSIPKPSRPSTAKGRVLSPQQNQHDSGNTELPPDTHHKRGSFDSPSRSDLDENRDLSPPRKLRSRLDTPSPEPHSNFPGREAGDLSPPRRRHNVDSSPPRPSKFRRQEVKDDPGSPESGLSPPRKSRRRPADSLSHRQNQESTEADHHPFSRTRKGSSDDLSPHQLSRTSPSVDLSPPRRATKRYPDDLSPPRRAQKSSLKPIEVQSSTLLDISVTKRGHHRSSSMLPLPQREHLESSKSSRNKDFSPPGPSPPINNEPPLSKEVRKGGLLTATEMKEEIERKKKDEKSRFASMDPLKVGKGAEAIHRDKDGKKISKEELNKPKEDKKEKPLEWGKGLAQKREAENRGKELELEKERPFARSRDDPELDIMLKERIRWGDPMAHLVKPKSSELILEDLGDNEKMKESGFVIPQTIPIHSWLKRGLDFLPNRFGIRPGRHWDGVDRSNGYEKELYKRRNEKQASETEAYLWSVADM